VRISRLAIYLPNAVHKDSLDRQEVGRTLRSNAMISWYVELFGSGESSKSFVVLVASDVSLDESKAALPYFH
jgi:hypothetical protein